MTDQSKVCQVCRAQPSVAEGVFMFGRTVEALIAASLRYSGDLDAWPSVWLCEECVDSTVPAFRALDDLPAEDLAGITGPLLVTICRLATGHQAGLEWIPPAAPAVAGGAGPASSGPAASDDAGPPSDVYDDLPESRNYDEAQPASYEDPGRP